MTATCIGWDVGGAHLKAVQLDGAGKVLAAVQIYCPLWRGLQVLELAVDSVLSRFNASTHLVTMTAELADIFSSRHDGVLKIAALMSSRLHGEVRYYAGRHGFVKVQEAGQRWSDIASMNWYASVQCVAMCVPNAVFVDIGSTTTDISLIENGVPHALGFTDAARMQCDALVYTGVVRTPLMAMAQKIAFAGNTTNVAAEHFATAADIYTLTGELDSDENMAETADGAAKTIEASACRIARMVGCDADDAALTAWVELAEAFKATQLGQIRQALHRQISQLADTSGLQLVGAGTGAFLAAQLADDMGLAYRGIHEFIAGDNEAAVKMAAVCFPAYAVARLGLENAGAHV